MPAVDDDVRERFAGLGVMGLPFDSGHVLGLRHWHRSSVGPPYTSVWHRDPEGRWAFWSTAAADVSCTRYTSTIAADVRQVPIDVSWPSPSLLVVEVASPSLRWEVVVGSSRRSRLLTAVASTLPASLLGRRQVLRAMGPLAGSVLGVGRLALVGAMPDGNDFRLVPSSVRPVRASTAVLEGVDLGTPAPLPTQATIGDFRVPQRGIVAEGAVDFSPRRGPSSAPPS